MLHGFARLFNAAAKCDLHIAKKLALKGKTLLRIRQKMRDNALEAAVGARPKSASPMWWQAHTSLTAALRSAAMTLAAGGNTDDKPNGDSNITLDSPDSQLVQKHMDQFLFPALLESISQQESVKEQRSAL